MGKTTPLRAIDPPDDTPGAALPVLARPPGAWWAWLGLHGGAGTSTVARALPGGHVLTGMADHERWPLLPVIPIVRSHAAGLAAAQRFAAVVADDDTWSVAGLIVVAARPGRLPRDLEQYLRLLSGGYQQVWRAGWVEAWHRGDPVTPQNTPARYRTVLADLVDTFGLDDELQAWRERRAAAAQQTATDPHPNHPNPEETSNP